MVGPDQNVTFRVASAPLLFLSYRGVGGAMKLYAPTPLEPTNYAVAPASAGLSIMSIYWEQYMWLSKESPYLSREGDPANRNAQWFLEPLVP